MTKRIVVSNEQFETGKSELEFIDKIYSVIPDESYLAEFFNSDLRDWMQYHIENDLSPNIIDVLSQTESAAADRAEKIQQLERTTAAQSNTIDNLIEQLDRAVSERDKEAQERLKAKRELRLVQSDLESAQILLDEYRQTLDDASRTQVELEIQKRKADHKEAEIVLLKSKLYDVMTYTIDLRHKHNYELAKMFNDREDEPLPDSMLDIAAKMLDKFDEFNDDLENWNLNDPPF